MKAKTTPTVQQERLVLHEHIPLATPLVIYIEPSGYCNLKCMFCPHGIDGKTLKKDIMSIGLFKKLIDDLSAFPSTVKLLRICGNGDPLMNRNIVEMLRYAREPKTTDRMELVTNGILLTSDLIKNLPRFLDRIIISVEGLSCDDYQRTCSTKIDYHRLLDNLHDLYAHKGECVIHIKTFEGTVLSESRRTSFFDTFSEHCDEIYVEQLVPMWPQLDTTCFPNEFRWGGDLIKHHICAQIFKGVQVQADGEVVPCCVDWKRVNILGNIYESSLCEIWNGDALRRLQVEHLIGNKIGTEPCKDCTMNDYCEVDNIDSYAEECRQRLRG
jgi:radical SAM protein with 4Fe4S-binding SPASM domain